MYSKILKNMIEYQHKEKLMSESTNKVRLFEQKQVRAVWDEEAEKWWFSVVDVVAGLTEQPTQRGATLYWGKLKQRLKEEGSELGSNTNQLGSIATQLKMESADGKKYLT